MVDPEFPVPPLGNTPGAAPDPEPAVQADLDGPDPMALAGARALRWATRLAQRGYVLVPVTIRPSADRHGKKDAEFHIGWGRGGTTDPLVLRDWAVSFPGCSFAILCGPSGVEVVDLDRHEGGPAWWTAQAMPVPEFVVDTPGGGEHHYWRRRPGAEPDDRLVNNAGKVAPGVDARTVGGLVFAPGSYVVGQEDRPYRARVELPAPDRLAQTPRAVLGLWSRARALRSSVPFEPGRVDQDRQFTQDEATAYVASEARDPLMAAEYGTNVNDRLNRAALVLGHFVPEFWSQDQAENALGEWLLAGPGKRNGWTALDREDIGSIRSGLRRGMAEPYARRVAPSSNPLPMIDTGVVLPASMKTAGPDVTWGDAVVPALGTTGTSDGMPASLAGGLPAPVEPPSPLEVGLERERLRRAVRRIVDAEERPPAAPPASTSLAALLAEPRGAAKYRISGLWPSGGKVLMSAPGKAGKTTTVGNLVRCLADASPFLAGQPVPDGWRVAAAGFETTPLAGRRVFLLDFEMTRDMLRDWLADQRIANLDGVHVELMRGAPFDPRDPQERGRWADYLKGLDIGVLIVDPIGPVLSSLGIDEHDNTAVGAVLWALDALCRDAGVTELLVVHHTGHEGERARGASAFIGWPDAVWELVRDKSLEGAGKRALRAYGRDVALDETVLELDRATRRLSLGSGSRAAARGSAHAEIVRDIVAGELEDRAAGSRGPTTNEIRAAARDTAIGTKQQDQHDAIQAARRLGLVHTHEGPRKALWHYLGSSCEECSVPVQGLGNTPSPSTTGPV